MSGLGGDELFAGYDIFKRHLSLLEKKWVMSFPKGLRNAATSLLLKLKPGIPSQKIKSILNEDYLDLENTYPYARQVLLDKQIGKLLSNKKLSANRVREILKEGVGYDAIGTQLGELSKVSYAEIHTYMQHTLLRDSDQMSMAHALELRTPFLDHQLVEYTTSISDALKFPNTPKQLLVESVGDLIPAEIVNRPKMGFTLPWKEWMKNELKPFCEERILALAHRSEFNRSELTKLWHSFLKGDPSITWSRIWYLVVLEDWLTKLGIND